MNKLISIFLISFILVACAGASVSTDEPKPLSTPANGPASACGVPSQWTIQLNRSGGIAGVDETMTLDSGGRLTVQSESPATDVRKTLSKDQVSAITGYLAEACPFEMKPNDAGCADCFLYKLDIQMDGKTYVMLATDVTLSDEVHPLINELSNLLQDVK